MVMTLDTAIKFTAKLEGQGLDQLKRGLQGLSQQSNRTSKDLDQLYSANKKLAQASGLSINSLQRQITVLTNLRNEAALGSRQFKFYSAELDKLNKQQARLTATSGRGGLLGGVAAIGGAGSLAGLAAAAGGAVAAKYVTDVGLAAEGAQVRLKALSDEYGEYNKAQESAARISQTLRISLTEAQQGFAGLYASLRPTGVTVEEIEKAFIGFTAAARNSGATAQESSAALIQLKQALASGVLQGEELRSIREQAPLVAQAIAKELGVSIGALKELAAEGEITSDVVLRALGKLNQTQLGKLNAQFNTGQQAIKDFQIALEGFGKRLAEIFGPAALAALKAFTGVLERATNLLGGAGGGDALQDRARASIQAQQEARKRFGALGGILNFNEFNQFRNQREAQLLRQFQSERVPPKVDRLDAEQAQAQRAADAEREAARAAARKKALEDEVKTRQQAEEKLADAAQRYAEQLADLRTETIKRAAELERDLADERLQIERDIAETRRRIAEQEQDAALEAERQRLSAAGLSTEGIDAARELGEISRRYSERRLLNEQNAADRQTQLQRKLEEFKLSVTDSIGKLQEGYARSVSNILQDAGDKLAAKMLNGAQAAAGALAGGGGGVGGPLAPSTLSRGSVRGGQLNMGTLIGLAKTAGFNDRDARVMAAIAMAESGGRSGAFNGNAGTGDKSYGLWQVNMLGAMGPERRRQFGIGSNEALFDPATNAQAARQVYQSQGFGAWSVYRSGAYKQYLAGAMQAQPMAAPAPGAVPSGFNSAPLMSGVDRAGQQLSDAFGTDKAVKDQEAFNDLYGDYLQKFGEYRQELDGVTRSASQQLTDQQRIYELQRSGLSPELARQRVEVENTAATERLRLEALENQLDQELLRTDLTEQQKQKIKELRAEVIARQLNEQGITEEILKQQQALAALNKRKQELETLKGSIGSTLSEGIIGSIDAAINAAVTGAKDLDDQLKQIASGVLKDIGNALLRFGLNSLLGGAFGGGFFKFAGGGVMTSSGSVPLKKYASGGVANRPQMALFGEGSKPEAFVPLPDGRRIPVALQGQERMREVMGSSPAKPAQAPVLNMKFETTKIGRTEYVSRDQLESAMAETRRAAARDGAKKGMSMTLDRLQQSPSTRTRVGLR